MPNSTKSATPAQSSTEASLHRPSDFPEASSTDILATLLEHQAGQVEDPATRLKQEVAEPSTEPNLAAVALDTVPVLVVVLDAQGRIVRFNRASEQTSGYSCEEVQGQHIGELLPSLEAKARLQAVFKKLRAGHSPQTAEGVWISHEGGQRLIEWSYSVLADEAGMVTYIIGAGLDITERRQAEEENMQLLETLSQQHQQLRALARQLAEVQEAERRHLSQELHDRVGQNLSALGFNLKFMETQLPDVGPAASMLQTRIADSLDLVARTTDCIRDVMAELRPPMLDDYGLVEALVWYAERFTARYKVRTEIQAKAFQPRLPASVETTLFRITQEALTNVVKHAGATRVTISIRTAGQSVRLIIADDGVGFDPNHQVKSNGGRSWGLLTMAERAEMIGGLYRIESQPGKGTRVVVEVDRPGGD